MGKMGMVQNADMAALPVLTRINSAKFKRSIYPGDTVRIQVKMSETISSVSFFKGKMTIGGKTAVQVDFACTMTSSVL
jgi:3-hydroxyacyl-[acyl-carrier-protein] dehydratase